MRIRYLRPAHIVASGDEIWLIDEFQPVAAVTDSRGAAQRLVEFSTSPIPSPDSARSVLRGESGIVLQDGLGNAITWVNSAGAVISRLAPGLQLRVVVGDTAWTTPRMVLDTGRPGPDGSPPVPGPLAEGEIVGLGPDGARQSIRVEQPVRSITPVPCGFLVRIAELPVPHPHGHNAWGWEYPTATAFIAAEELIAASRDGAVLSVHGRPAVEAPPRPPGPQSWLRSEPEAVRRYGFPAAGRLWSAGAPRDGDRIERPAVVTGHDPASGAEIVRVDLGVGDIRDMCAVGEQLWVAVARRRHLADARDRGIEVVAVSASGDRRTVLVADAVDISGMCWTAVRPSAGEMRTHIETVQERFGYLTRYWGSAEGTLKPLSDGLRDPKIDLVGEWPDMRLQVMFTHPSRPGLRLRRNLRLFDEIGRPVDHEYAVIHLMEDLDTGYLAPAGEAVSGILDT